jgi:GNAT superfamily N-acetyltransferase
VPFIWKIAIEVPSEDLAAITHGVLNHGRERAQGGNALPIACTVRDGTRVVAGGAGRTEYRRLFVGHLWVAEELRGNGVGSRVLAELEAEASKRGCEDSMIETLDDRVAQLYSRLGYKLLAKVPNYVGPFNRHIMLKSTLSAPVR